jgi:hypothetical protein
LNEDVELPEGAESGVDGTLRIGLGGDVGLDEPGAGAEARGRRLPR